MSLTALLPRLNGFSQLFRRCLCYFPAVIQGHAVKANLRLMFY